MLKLQSQMDEIIINGFHIVADDGIAIAVNLETGESDYFMAESCVDIAGEPISPIHAAIRWSSPGL